MLLDQFPVVGLSGARQVGKSTLARQLAGPDATFFDLERPSDRAALAEAELVLDPLRGLVILDEIQRAPNLFPLLRVLADRPGTPARFLVLGSASPDLLRQGSETLAGRIAWHALPGLSLDEVGAELLDQLWVRGGFPRSFLARNDAESADWRREFVRTFLERDLPQLGVGTPATTLGRFWSMLAHWHGQTWNGAELARAFGVSGHTVRRYLDLLEHALVVRVLPAWHANLSKRQVRSPKVYLTDSGLLHSLLDIDTPQALIRHPKIGASWEGFLVGQVAERLGARSDQLYTWSTHGGAELDLLVRMGPSVRGFELKRTSTPRVTEGMRIALADLELDELVVVHAGARSFPLGDRIRAVAASRLLEDL
jgi:predicted AAA+ superfamily ATPase